MGRGRFATRGEEESAIATSVWAAEIVEDGEEGLALVSAPLGVGPACMAITFEAILASWIAVSMEGE